MEIKNILAVYDPTTDAQPALQRAARLAEGGKLKLYAYSCIYKELGKSAKESGEQEKLISAQQEILNKAVAPFIARGVDVTTEVEWDEDWYEAVVAASDRIDASVVLKASHKHSATQRLLKKTSDRALLRQCDCPVFLVKTELTNDARKILAAIHFLGESESYEQLNKNIIEFSSQFLHAENVELHFINAHKDMSDRPDRGALVRACGVASDRVHIKMGEPDKVIVETAKELGINLVVIGNSARSGLSALINTNTAEKILDELNCDLLALP